MYPFVLNVSMKLQRIIPHIVVEVYGFKSFTKLLQLGYVFFKTDSFESFKWNEKLRPLQTKIGFFGGQSTKQAAVE